MYGIFGVDSRLQQLHNCITIYLTNSCRQLFETEKIHKNKNVHLVHIINIQTPITNFNIVAYLPMKYEDF